MWGRKTSWKDLHRKSHSQFSIELYLYHQLRNFRCGDCHVYYHRCGEHRKGDLRKNEIRNPNHPNIQISMAKKQLPNFLIIGAAKSGTTSLHEELSKHPEIFMCNPKEPHFLANLPDNTIGGNYGYPRVDEAGYYSLFQKVKNEKIIGESSVSILFYKNAIKKAKSLLGQNIKIVVVLRNPVDRAFSNYMMHVRDGFENKTFD